MTQPDNIVPAILQEVALQIPDEFQVQEFLGEGGHGIVLKALQKTMQKPVALKIIKTDGTEDMQKQVSRMQNEAKILAKLVHPNIVRVFQMCTCKDGTPFLVCEYLEGITLSQYLRQNPQPSPREIFQIFTQILDALELAHNHNLLHRDLKPSNVMILTDHESSGLQIKLLDFGIAREFETSEHEPLGLTRTIQLSGSAPYMSPEQCKGVRIDQRADLYSVACMLFECLAGSAPFRGETPMHTRYLQIHELPQMPESDKFEQTVSRAAVYKLALQCLSKDVEKRPANAAELKQQLIAAMPNALKRPNWTPKKGKGSLKLVSTSILICCAGAFLWQVSSGIRFQKNENKNSGILTPIGTHKTTKLDAHSTLTRLREIALRAEKLLPANSSKKLQENMTLHNEVLRCISELSPKERGTSYIAWRSRATIERAMNLDDESRKSWLTALSFCKDNRGNYTTEACDCFANMGDIAFKKGDFREAEALASKGLAVATEKPAKQLEIPTIVELRSGLCMDTFYRIKAEVFERAHQYADAAAEWNKVAQLKLSQDKVNEYGINSRLQSNCLFQAGDLKGSKKVIEIAANVCCQHANPNEALEGLDQLISGYTLLHFPELANTMKSRRQELLNRKDM